MTIDMTTGRKIIRRQPKPKGMARIDRGLIVMAAIAALFLLATIVGAFAQTCQTIGNMTYCNGNDGSSYTGQRIGDIDYWSGSTRVQREDGFTSSVPLQKTCQHIGNMTYCN